MYSDFDQRKGGRFQGALLVSIAVLLLLGVIIGGYYVFLSAGKLQSISTQIDTVTPVAIPADQRRIVRTGDDPAVGPVDAPVQIVAFEDFECPYCKQAQSAIDAMLIAYPTQVRFVYVDFPLTEIHPQAQQAAVAAECAHRQELFWPYHNRLFNSGADLSRAGLIAYAREIKLDEQKFISCLDGNEAIRAVNSDVQEAKRLGLTGTPTFFINGVKYEGALTLNAWKTIIDFELDK